MAQIKRLSWTNASTAVARNEDVGFTVAKIEIFNLSTAAALAWTADMADASIFNVGVPAYTTTNGITPLAESAAYGPAISGFTNASPGVITCSDTSKFGIAAGDTIKVTGIADDGAAANSLNGTFTVASLTATTITLNEATNSGYSAYVSGGFVIRVSDSSGAAIPIENKAIRGVTIGTSAVGGNSESMVAIVYGEEPVV